MKRHLSRRLVLLGIAVFGALSVLILVLLADRPRPSYEVAFPSDGIELSGTVFPPTDPAARWVVLVHGSRRQGHNHTLYRAIANRLDREYGVLAFDLATYGLSRPTSGHFRGPFLDRSADVRAAVRFVRGRFNVPPGRIALIGHSFGATQVMRAAHGSSFALVVAISPFDWSLLKPNTESLASFLRRVRERTGIEIPQAAALEEIGALQPSVLFDPCPASPIVLIRASRDYPNTVLHHLHKVPEPCRSRLETVTIPFADHMYGTESGSRLGPLGTFRSRVEVALLTCILNSLLNRPPHESTGAPPAASVPGG